MTFGADAIQNTLINTASLTALVEQRIYNERVIPQNVTALPVINYYRISPINGGDAILEVTWSINCRDAKQEDAEAVAQIVYDTMNRELNSISGSDYFYRCNLLPVIPPVDKEDVFNVPVEIYLRGR